MAVRQRTSPHSSIPQPLSCFRGTLAAALRRRARFLKKGAGGMISDEQQKGVDLWVELEKDLHFAHTILNLKSESRADIQRAAKKKGLEGVDDC
jgi:hypothetical protein